MLATTRLSLLLCGVLGVGTTAALAVYAGIGAVYGALDDVGWLGIAWVCMLQLGAMAFCAAAWRSVADNGEAGDMGPICSQWNLLGTPTLYLLDAKGVIRHKWLDSPGEKTIDEAIDNLIKEAAGKN